MSRGFGVRERHALSYLEHYAAVMVRLGVAVGDDYLPVAALARLLDDLDEEAAPRSSVESTRRACKSLAGAGLVELRRAAGPSGALEVRLSVEGRNRGQHL